MGVVVHSTNLLYTLYQGGIRTPIYSGDTTYGRDTCTVFITHPGKGGIHKIHTHSRLAREQALINGGITNLYIESFLHGHLVVLLQDMAQAQGPHST